VSAIETIEENNMRDWLKERMEFSKKFQQQEIEVKNPYIFDPKVE